jgi:general secretion pathway protein G
MMKNRYDRGFTLIEVLVILGIIAILAGIALPAYNSYLQKTKKAEAMQVLKRIETAIIALATDTGQWPKHQAIGKVSTGGTNEIYDLNSANSGLVATDGAFPNWSGPYIPSVPLDPWGHKYFFDTDYRISGVDYIVLGSYGTGNVCNNCYNATDIRLILPEK